MKTQQVKIPEIQGDQQDELLINSLSISQKQSKSSNITNSINQFIDISNEKAEKEIDLNGNNSNSNLDMLNGMVQKQESSELQSFSGIKNTINSSSNSQNLDELVFKKIISQTEQIVDTSEKVQQDLQKILQQGMINQENKEKEQKSINNLQFDDNNIDVFSMEIPNMQKAESQQITNFQNNNQFYSEARHNNFKNQDSQQFQNNNQNNQQFPNFQNNNNNSQHLNSNKNNYNNLDSYTKQQQSMNQQMKYSCNLEFGKVNVSSNEKLLESFNCPDGIPNNLINNMNSLLNSVDNGFQSKQKSKSKNGTIEDTINYYQHEACRLYIANVVLTNQVKELLHDKNELMQKIAKLEKRHQDSIIFTEEKKKRQRRAAQEIERHYKCPCEPCQKSYGSEGSLAQHIKLKHPEFYSTISNNLSQALAKTGQPGLYTGEFDDEDSMSGQQEEQREIKKQSVSSNSQEQLQENNNNNNNQQQQQNNNNNENGQQNQLQQQNNNNKNNLNEDQQQQQKQNVNEQQQQNNNNNQEIKKESINSEQNDDNIQVENDNEQNNQNNNNSNGAEAKSEDATEKVENQENNE